MTTYTLVIKAGAHPSGWGLYGWMRQKLPDYVWYRPGRLPMTAPDDERMPNDWTVYVDTTVDLTAVLNAWFCEPYPAHPAPYPPGTLLFWNKTEQPWWYRKQT